MTRALALLLAAIAVATAGSIARADDLEGIYLVSGDDTSALAIYPDSVATVSSSNRRAWTVLVRKRPITLAGGQLGYGIRDLAEYDCAQGRMRALQTTLLDRNGRLLKAYAEITQWEFVAPNTAGSKALKAVCDPSSLDRSRILHVTLPAFFSAFFAAGADNP